MTLNVLCSSFLVNDLIELGMTFLTKTFHQKQDLQGFIASHIPGLYTSSKTSTVIPYELLEENLKPVPNNFTLCDLSQLPKKLELLSNGNMVVGGGVTWADARSFLESKGRNLKIYPTEVLATITAGVATSCTGERSFGFGNLRKQITRIKYLNFKGEILELFRDRPFSFLDNKKYNEEFQFYKNFKNAPFPRFEMETDLMIGTEGQLGIVLEAEIETTDNFDVNYLFILLPSWEENLKGHLEIHQAVQSFRGKIISCELVDHNSIKFLKAEDQLGKDQDVIFLEIRSSEFEQVHSDLLAKLKTIKEDSIFEISRERFHHIRASVPRRIFERNTHMGVTKMGTDVQVSGEKFEELLLFYREAKKVGIEYNLFGHFGDAHLHFNFMPKPDEIKKCQTYFLELYDNVFKWKGSPFAEHGIGLLKRKYIARFHGETQKNFFKELKKQFDPYQQFFPQGFMGDSFEG